VRRLTPSVRHRATYDRSLSVLRKVKTKRSDTIYTKSGMMLGLGEAEEEVMMALEDCAVRVATFSRSASISSPP